MANGYSYVFRDPKSGREIEIKSKFKFSPKELDEIAEKELFLKPKARDAATQYGLPQSLFEKQIEIESNWNPKAISPAGAQGIAQFMPGTAKMVGLKNPFNPDEALPAAARHMKTLLDNFGGDYRMALAAYNAGGGRVTAAVKKYGKNWLEHMPLETQNYVKNIMGSFEGGRARIGTILETQEISPEAEAAHRGAIIRETLEGHQARLRKLEKEKEEIKKNLAVLETAARIPGTNLEEITRKKTPLLKQLENLEQEKEKVKKDIQRQIAKSQYDGIAPAGEIKEAKKEAKLYFKAKRTEEQLKKEAEEKYPWIPQASVNRDIASLIERNRAEFVRQNLPKEYANILAKHEQEVEEEVTKSFPLSPAQEVLKYPAALAPIASFGLLGVDFSKQELTSPIIQHITENIPQKYERLKSLGNSDEDAIAQIVFDEAAGLLTFGQLPPLERIAQKGMIGAVKEMWSSLPPEQKIAQGAMLAAGIFAGLHYTGKAYKITQRAAQSIENGMTKGLQKIGIPKEKIPEIIENAKSEVIPIFPVKEKERPSVSVAEEKPLVSIEEKPPSIEGEKPLEEKPLTSLHQKIKEKLTKMEQKRMEREIRGETELRSGFTSEDFIYAAYKTADLILQGTEVTLDFLIKTYNFTKEQASWVLSKARSIVGIEGDDIIATANVSTAAQRAKAGLPLAPKMETIPLSDLSAKAEKAGIPQKALELSLEVIKREKRSFTPLEEAGIRQRLVEIDEALSKAEIGSDEYRRLYDELDTITRATNISGTEWHLQGMARQIGLKHEYTTRALTSKIQKAKEGIPLTEKEREFVINASKKHAQIQNALEETILKEQTKLGGEGLVEIARKKNKISKTKTEYELDREYALDLAKDKWDEPPFEDIGQGLPHYALKAQRLAKIHDEIMTVVESFVPEEQIEAAKSRFYRKLGNETEAGKREWKKHWEKAKEVAQKVAEAFQEKGMDINPEEILAVMGGQVPIMRQQQLITALEAYKQAAQEQFKFAFDSNAKVIKEIREKIKETTLERKSPKTLEEYKKLKEAKNEEKKLKETEKEFWKQIKKEEKLYQKEKRDIVNQARKEYIQFWKESLPGQIEKLYEKIGKLQEDLAEVQEGIHPRLRKKELPISEELISLTIQKKVLEHQIEKEIANIKFKQKDLTLSRFLLDIPGISRSLLTMMDDSFIGNQAGWVLLTDTKSVGIGFRASLKAVADKGADKIFAEIRSSPYFEKAVAARLELPEITTLAGEEFFPSELLEKVPLLGYSARKSRQVFDAAGGKTRMAMFEEWAKFLEKNKISPVTIEDYRLIAETINTFTGRSMLPLGVATRPFFALRFLISLFETAYGIPFMKAVFHWKKTGNIVPLKLIGSKYARGYGLVLLSLGLTDMLLKQMGSDWKVGLHPSDPRFGQIWKKEGNETRAYNIIPEQIRQPFRLFGLVFLGRRNENGKISFNPEWEFGTQITTKFAPIINFLWNLSYGIQEKKRLGKEFSPKTLEGWKHLLGSSFIPISIQQIDEILSSKKMTPAEKAMAILLSIYGRAPSIWKTKVQ